MTNDKSINWDQLIDAALRVRERAYAKYSQFHVGAALLTSSGEIIVGCNVENASYGLTQCAERSAVTAAVAAGHTQFVAIALTGPGGPMPCGACRQVLAEFCHDLPVLIVDADIPSKRMLTNLRELLPGVFKL
jgi:cytidine deaminase